MSASTDVLLQKYEVSEIELLTNDVCYILFVVFGVKNNNKLTREILAVDGTWLIRAGKNRKWKFSLT